MTTPDSPDAETLLRELFDAAIDAVAGEPATRRALQEPDIQQRLQGGPVYLAAIGKAADAMTQGALASLSDSLTQGLVITKHGHLSESVQADPRLVCHEAGHPTPDDASLRAGAALYRFISELPNGARLVFLVSGGASALVEHLIDGVSLEDLRALTSRLLAGGYPIGDMNHVRRNLSCLKGGRLALQLPDVEVVQLLISDVPGDHPSDIGSGPLVPPERTADLPAALAELLEPGWLDHRVDPPPPEAPCWRRIHTHIIASSQIAQQAVVEAAQARALTIVREGGSLDGDVASVASRLGDELIAADGRRGLYVWGGEPTVRLPDDPGRGGRNQHLALALGLRLADAALDDLAVLVCGTDGTDGPTDDAGGLVSARTVAAGREAGLDAAAFLDRADAGSYLQQTGALVTTGPTGTNVMDLVLAWRYS